MANREGLNVYQHNVEEIDYNEIERIQIVGKGSFGIVYKGKWRGSYVAVKHIESEAEKVAFSVEVRQLSRVKHPNIIMLHGACTEVNRFCLVMEYAEGGSLYNVLHCKPFPTYSAGHAISWALQCARGVAYLHNMHPKPIIHRDLKPPNLLLVSGGTFLKICDFGTACDKTSYMTNNKGSAAWMAPEVFEDTKYTEKCDVFSWGIILWEVLSREKPFHDIGGSAYCILWAVHSGKRPPLIEGCPRPLEKLYTRCWDKDPSNRPSMNEVVLIMEQLFTFFSGHDEPIQYDLPSESTVVSGNEVRNTIEDTTESDETDRTQSEITTNSLIENLRNSQPTDMNGSLFRDPGDVTLQGNYSNPLRLHVEPEGGWGAHNNGYLEECTDNPAIEIRAKAGLDTVLKLPPQGPEKKIWNQGRGVHEEVENIYLMLDPQLHPVEPDTSSQQSMQIFQEHKDLAEEYLKVQTEMAYLSKHMEELAERLSLSAEHQQENEDEEVRKLESEKESLVQLHRNLKRQLELLRRQRGSENQRGVNTPMEGGWVLVPHLTSSSQATHPHPPHPPNPHPT